MVYETELSRRDHSSPHPQVVSRQALVTAHDATWLAGMRMDAFPLLRLLESRAARWSGMPLSAPWAVARNFVQCWKTSRWERSDRDVAVRAAPGKGTASGTLRSRFEEPQIGAVPRALQWEVDPGIGQACEEVREPFKLRRDVARLELEIDSERGSELAFTGRL